MTQTKNLAQWLNDAHSQASAHGDRTLTQELVSLIGDIAIACKALSYLVQQGEIAGVLGAAGTSNVQGEDQKKLDIIANDVFIDSTITSGYLAGLASEEMDDMLSIPDGVTPGDYLLTFDPLDGSSNIDVNGSVGTIFSIIKFTGEGQIGNEAFLTSGREQVCAGYCLYSSASMLVMSVGEGVHGFTLDTSVGEFILTHPDMCVPAETNEYAINASNSRHWESPLKRYIEELEAGSDGAAVVV